MKYMSETMPDKTDTVWELLDVNGLAEFTALMKKTDARYGATYPRRNRPIYKIDDAD